MDAERIELKLALTEAGLPNPKMQTFSERLNVQKRVYLIQSLGYDLGYRFGWYLRGPYSRHLTEDAFTLRDEITAGDTDADQFDLANSAKETISKAKELWALPNTTGNIEADNWLELLASVHYLKKIAYWPGIAEKNFDHVFAKLIELKPQFKHQDEIVMSAWKRLVEFSLIDAKPAA